MLNAVLVVKKSNLDGISREELQGLLIENADEPYAYEIATTIVTNAKRGKKIETTIQLKDAIEEALKCVPEKERKDAVKKSCAVTPASTVITPNTKPRKAPIEGPRVSAPTTIGRSTKEKLVPPIFTEPPMSCRTIMMANKSDVITNLNILSFLDFIAI